MKRSLGLAITALFAAAPDAGATISDVLGGSVPCTVQSGANAGERHCAGIFTTFDGAPIDVNVGFPPAPASIRAGTSSSKYPFLIRPTLA